MEAIVKPPTTNIKLHPFRAMVASQSNSDAELTIPMKDAHRPRSHEVLALRSSITLMDLRIAMALVIGDQGVRISLKCGEACENGRKPA